MARSQYELLIEAASALVDTDLLDRPDIDDAISEEEAAAFLHANRDALNRARQALGPQCAVPLRYEEEFFEQNALNYTLLTYLGRSFALELVHARNQGDWDRVVAAGLDLLDLANGVRRGGLVVDALVGDAIGGTALARIREFRFYLDREIAGRLAKELLRLDGEREPFAAIVDRDLHWENVSGRAQQEVDFAEVLELIAADEGFDEETKETVQSWIQEHAELTVGERRDLERQLDCRQIALIRLLAVEAGLIGYQAMLGEYPSELSTIVPAFIPSLPDDPFTGVAFKYYREGEGYLLYSPARLAGIAEGCWEVG